MENAADRSALGVLMEDGGDGGDRGKQKSPVVAASSSGIEGGTVWQMSSLIASEPGESGPYPQRPGASDCSHYVKTGYCSFAMRCKYNHPTNRKLAAIVATIKEGYPQRVGQLECKHYLRTGTCKYGAICKYHHPRDKAGKVELNLFGYPLRPNERECTFYLRNGDCKFASTCKYHHPQPSNTMVALWGSPVYSSTSSPIAISQQPYPGGLMSWPLSGASFVSNPRSEDSSNYAQLVLPQGLLPVPSWDTFSGQSGGLSSSQSQQQARGSFQYNGTPHQNITSTGALGVSSYISGSVPVNEYAVQKKNIFPERPDRTECQFYMKTGECKFGATCRYHHPRVRVIPAPNCPLSPLGLPLRPGQLLCHFYTRCGVCKYGPSCKFDHPMATPVATYAYNLPTPSSSDVPVIQSSLGSSSEPTAPALSSETPVGASSRTV